MPFAQINPTAKIYVPAAAFGEYYSVNKAGEPHYIGLAEEIKELPQVVKVTAEDGIFQIDDELSLFSGIGNEHPIPSANRRLKKKADGELVQDDFAHEQCLVIKEGVKSILLSGCAHHGILNILDRYIALYGKEPDIVISGFHMMRKNGYSDEDINMIIDTALALRQYKTVFYTGHCTGVEPYNAMKKLMGSQLHYVHSGDEVRIRTGIERILWNPADYAVKLASDGTAGKLGPLKENVSEKTEKSVVPESGNPDQTAEAIKVSKNEPVKTVEKKRSEYMKWHKIFAWGTVACFVMTMVTGYKRK